MPVRKTAARAKPHPTRARARPARKRPVATVEPAEAMAAPAAARSVKPVKDDKPPKLHRKPVRDSFTMPEADFALIATLKARALAGGREAKKSELLRAGLHALAALDGVALVAALAQLEPVKIGRPKKHR